MRRFPAVVEVVVTDVAAVVLLNTVGCCVSVHESAVALLLEIDCNICAGDNTQASMIVTSSLIS